MNDHLKVLYKVWVFDKHNKPEFCREPSNDHSWAVWLNCPSGFREEVFSATAGLSLTLDPMGKIFQNASSLKPLGKLKPNCP
jgi:hypothetical protein